MSSIPGFTANASLGRRETDAAGAVSASPGEVVPQALPPHGCKFGDPNCPPNPIEVTCYYRPCPKNGVSTFCGWICLAT
jgi:hypothetical protein